MRYFRIIPSIILLLFLGINTVSPQHLGFEDESEESRMYRENRSQDIINLALLYPTEFDSNYIPQGSVNTYYFRDKMSLSMILSSPEFYNNRFFPYSYHIDESFVGSYSTYYKVCYDASDRVLREDYIENDDLIYYVLYFYEDYYNVRKRVVYFNDDKEENIIFDYFYNEENFGKGKSIVEIKYIRQDIDIIKVEYRTNKNNVINIEQYNPLLQKDRVWYYYDDRVMLTKKEYWNNGKLIKYMTCSYEFERTYYNENGAAISREEFYSIST